MWAKRGKQPVVKSAPTQEKIALAGFVNPITGILKTYECGMFNFESITDMVKQFSESDSNVDKKKLIILDNAPWHKKAVRLMRENEDFSRIEFLFLPTYSPDLNPIERVWRITRKERTHNRYFDKVQALRNTLTIFFTQFMNPNAKLKNLCS